MTLEDLPWPIQDYDALAEAVGGADAPLEVEGRTLTLAELRPAMPAYYFPISGEADLRVKLADAAARMEDGPPGQAGTHAGPAAGAAAPEGGDCWS